MKTEIIYGIYGAKINVEDVNRVEIINLKCDNIFYMKAYVSGNDKKIQCFDYYDTTYNNTIDTVMTINDIKDRFIDRLQGKINKPLYDMDGVIMSIWIDSENDDLAISKITYANGSKPIKMKEVIPYSKMFSELRTNANYRELLFIARSISADMVYKMRPDMDSKTFDNEIYLANQDLINKMKGG